MTTIRSIDMMFLDDIFEMGGGQLRIPCFFEDKTHI